MTALAALALCATTVAPIELTPTDDAWVYVHASSTSDPFLRAWGSGDAAVDNVYPPGGEYSYSYLAFELPRDNSVPARLGSAKLMLLVAKAEALDKGLVEKYPLEARPLSGAFREQGWSMQNAQLAPGAKPYGLGTADFKPDEDFWVTIDLMKEPGAFQQAWTDALAGNHRLGLAITTKMDAQSGVFYRFYSRENDPSKRPRLIIAPVEE